MRVTKANDNLLWINFKEYEIRVEQDKEYNNGNLVIYVFDKGADDYKQKMEVEYADL